MLIAAMLLASAAPSAQTSAILESIRAEDQRVMTIGHRLAVRGRELCPDTQVSLAGVRVHVAGQYARSVRAEAQAVFGLGAYPVILAVAPDGAAARAGLQAGDWVISIDREQQQLDPNDDYAAVERFDTTLSRALAKGAARLVVRRGGTERVVTLGGEPGCASRVELVPGKKLNAAADGTVVQITTGVLSQTQNDDELAFIIAHEMAHNILRHAEKSGRKRDEEVEADRLGLKLMKSAGYDPHAAARFWARFGKKTGHGIFSDSTHMRTKARVAFLRDEASALTQ